MEDFFNEIKDILKLVVVINDDYERVAASICDDRFPETYLCESKVCEGRCEEI